MGNEHTIRLRNVVPILTLPLILFSTYGLRLRANRPVALLISKKHEAGHRWIDH
jgi:hypothetical protein